MKHERFVAAGAVRRMQNVKLCAAWNKWQQTAASLALERLTVEAAALKLLNRALTAAWNTWCAWAAEHSHASNCTRAQAGSRV